MITRGLIGVRDGEGGHPLIEAPTLPDIAGDRHRVPGARVCAGEDVRALLGERPQWGAMRALSGMTFMSRNWRT